MTIANYITVLRIILVPVFVAVLLDPGFLALEARWLAVVILAVAAFTDALDGYLARVRNEVTRLGKLLDPIADKLLISAAFISIVQLGLAPAWIVVIILGREFAVSGLRLIAASEGFQISVSNMGKFKMVVQVLAIGLLIFSAQTREFGLLLLYVVMALALISMGIYFQKFWIGMQPERREQLSKRRTLSEIKEEVISTTRSLKKYRRERKLERRERIRQRRFKRLKRRMALAARKRSEHRSPFRRLVSLRRKTTSLKTGSAVLPRE